jgi:DNA-binding response OmpR family regulator
MPSILIVEDDPNISGLYSFILKKRGHQVVQAMNVDEGLKYLAEFRPELIILDLLMPVENGVDFLKKAELAKDYPQTKVLVVSNVDSADFAKQLEPYHVADYLTKAEYTPHRIADKIEGLLGVEAGKLKLGPFKWIKKRLR